ncbi:aminotransferase class I/II-fold pyridoxal phosphate-dependent enzyme [Candidatus Dojkabacteria bacterium]|nr:aminotransferase class I/II-fold pyridoxal phosphate-dependent enzyme [Candidatus Dojkabacteria bacterium]
MKKTSIAWAPNAQKDDLLLAFKLLFQPWKWYGHKDVTKLENKFSEYIGQDSLSFDSGRSALYAILKSYNIKEGDEIALQAFTCVALPNPILWTGATPIYIDVDKKNFNLDIDDLEKKLTSNTKAVIVQYTFGICPNIERIIEICKMRNLLLIEDCCHNLGQEINIKGKPYKAGTIGDAAIFSFGMEKVISGTRGGMATTQNPEILKRLQKFQIRMRRPRLREVLRGIMNSINWKAKENFGIFGELFFKLMIKLKLQDFGLTKLELIGKKAAWLPYTLPNTNAVLILNQLHKIDKFNYHRKETVEKYYELIKNSELKLPDLEYVRKFACPVWLRLPVIVDNPKQLVNKTEKQNIYLGNWYTSVIHCKDVDLNAMKYIKGSCPNAEWLSAHTINLPTHIGITETEVGKIVGQILQNPS